MQGAWVWGEECGEDDGGSVRDGLLLVAWVCYLACKRDRLTILRAIAWFSEASGIIGVVDVVAWYDMVLLSRPENGIMSSYS